MENSKTSSFLSFIAGVILVIVITYISVDIIRQNPSEPIPPCIEEVLIWDFQDNNPKTMWIIQGEKYLVKETPRGQKEIVGKISRYTTNYKRIIESK